MTRFLVAAGTVHAMAAGCDYVAQRTAADDVVALSVADPDLGISARDAADAVNVAEVRLGNAVEAVERTGETAAVLREIVAEYGVDELVLVAPVAGVETASSVAADLGVPVVVVPDR